MSAAPRGGVADDAERLARVALSVAGEPGHPRLAGLVADLGAVATLEGLHEQGRAGEAGGDLAARLERADPERELDRAARLGLRFVVPGDAEWPAQLGDLAHAPHLNDRGDVPLGLWCRGPLRLDAACASAVAVVGSRSATTYGTEVADGLGRVLAQAGWTTVSGAAFGIDQAAHRGALRAGGPSVAVLACGADRAYPTAHRDLIDHLAEVGLVVSESPPGAAPMRIRFLARNRLIAALAGGTVVVEAAVRSGALNTGNWAGSLGRVLMGVPGPVTSAQSVGVHQMIRARDALLVTRGEEVLEAVAPVGSHQAEELRADDGPRDRLSLLQRQVLDAVPVVRGAAATSIAAVAGIAPTRTAQALEVLLEAGLVEHGDGRWRVLDRAAPG
ncbi:DNA-processing protein DprA [Nocardioides aequoreus]|uniref:DNA-processing protein DprA n=1 Tax=Nocardioides aequoreus TaxID=397278 RepID=UPI0004C33CB2|nr:DNA-processing protein DprA [Nocardioides aequoreus]